MFGFFQLQSLIGLLLNKQSNEYVEIQSFLTSFIKWYCRVFRVLSLLIWLLSCSLFSFCYVNVVFVPFFALFFSLFNVTIVNLISEVKNKVLDQSETFLRLATAQNWILRTWERETDENFGKTTRILFDIFYYHYNYIIQS